MGPLPMCTPEDPSQACAGMGRGSVGHSQFLVPWGLWGLYSKHPRQNWGAPAHEGPWLCVPCRPQLSVHCWGSQQPQSCPQRHGRVWEGLLGPSSRSPRQGCSPQDTLLGGLQNGAVD